ncbi:protein FAR-RED IMPAIRED RESPONSE 1-like [Zingiber officinale]|uniref:protein FAR-RED IMPAIRED RESPONSE 1-like n=1 Tax=Zingiber officinale TaxID=94328 RepID=UPI001C4D59E4|nr:protein FAR-RED IMPAIRED RESPONSE 1-like [Zingiber officinale]
MKNIMKIPSEYILKRWTRKAKGGYFGVIDSIANKGSFDPKTCSNMRYKELSGLSVQLVTKAAEREDTYKVVKDGLLSMFKIVDERLQVNEPTVQHSIEREFEIDEGNSLGVKGIKTKKKTVSGKRLKGALDKISKKRKAARTTNQTSTFKPIEEHYESISNMPNVECQRMIHQVALPQASICVLASQISNCDESLIGATLQDKDKLELVTGRMKTCCAVRSWSGHCAMCEEDV